jgi:predicted O-linked N-acetylglucosamine transferase (SPINDLY family)
MATTSEALAIAIRHHQGGRLQAAEQIYRQILAAEPEHADALHLLGVVAHQTGRHALAVDCIRRAIALKGDAAVFHLNLGNALKDQGKLDEAVACYRRALELNPDYVEAHNNLGVAFREQGKLDEAVACCRRALELKPDYAEAHNNLGVAFKDQGKLDEAVAAYRRAVEARPNLAAVHGNLLYAQLFSPGGDARSLYEEHRRWNQRHAAPLAKFILPHGNDRSPDRRLKVGYVSPDFRDHVVGRNLLPLFREHDRRRFEIACYADVYRPDEVTGRFRGHADAWRNTTGLSDGQLAQRIRADGIDVLVDLTLHMAHNRLLVFARQPAPVQVTFAGYPGTTGLSTIDYRGIDIGLDTVPYNGHTTSLDAFWMGVPVVTLVGPTVVGRAGSSQLRNLGLPELIASSPEQYVEVAAELARDLPRLSNLRATLRRRMQSSPLMDAPRFARNIEAAYRGMWRRWCAR